VGRSGSGPERTCVGCRQTAPKDALVRLALAPDGTLFPDGRGTLPGRGAWVHPRTSCVDAVVQQPKRLQRSLGSVPSTEGFASLLRASVLRWALDGLSMAQAAGALVGGRDLLTRALRNDQVGHVIVAEGASERSIGEFKAAASESVVFVELPLTAPALGERVGKGPRAALGVRRSRAAAHLIRQLRRLRDLG